jgi:hypothetical protein
MAGPFDYDAQQQSAFEALSKMGACIGKYDEVCIHVEMIPCFGGEAIGDAELVHVVDYVNQIGNVRNLDLGETAITDASASELGRLTNLVFLCLNGTLVSDKVLPFVRKIIGLKELVLSGTAVTDAAVVELVQMQELTFLQLYGTRMSKRAIIELKTMLPAIVEA